MANIKFFYDNLIKIYTPTETSEHENFPVENLQHRDFNKAWRSRYGAGSGWGNFKIVAGVNDKADFKDFGGTVRVATLTPGEYNADEYIAHVATQMGATPTTDTFTGEYLESSNKFKITDDAGNFELLLNTGANKSTSWADTVGFDDSADKTGADNYTANNVRIHSEERIIVDLTTNTNIYGIEIRGHNFSASATVEAIFSDDAWATIAEHPDFTVQDNIMILEWDVPKDYRYAGIRIKDPENSDLYVKVGVLSISPQLQPIINFLSPEPDIDRIDPSVVFESGAGQESSLQQDSYDTWAYRFKVKGDVSASDLVTNGGFDSDTTGWTAGNSALLASVVGGQSGNCLRITENGDDSPRAYQTMTVEPGSYYRFTFYEKQGTETDYTAFIYDGINLIYLIPIAWIVGDITWTQKTMEFVTPNNCTSIRIFFQTKSLNAEGKTFYFDTVTLEKISNKIPFDTMFNTVGTSKAFFICEDPDSPLTTTKYVRFTGWKWKPIKRSIDHWELMVGVKEQR